VNSPETKKKRYLSPESLASKREKMNAYWEQRRKTTTS
jgi:hypothetical protein